MSATARAGCEVKHLVFISELQRFSQDDFARELSVILFLFQSMNEIDVAGPPNLTGRRISESIFLMCLSLCNNEHNGFSFLLATQPAETFSILRSCACA
tara:strand:- start:3176 stop:3472 length:297 start_codon:yes stop_codon:yes gene_type:complete